MPKNKPFLRRQIRSYMQRRVNEQEVRQRFLIVCEGTKTEPIYFEQFRVPGLVIQLERTGRNTISLVEEALKLRREGEYDQVWCVFDKDDFSIDQFEQAIQVAVNNRMKVAYSNQAFELWYVLHFCYMQNANGREAYREMLNRFLGFKYEKNAPRMYQILFSKMDTAIENARRLIEEYHPCRPGRDDPSTRVHELIQELREQAKPLMKRD